MDLSKYKLLSQEEIQKYYKISYEGYKNDEETPEILEARQKLFQTTIRLVAKVAAKYQDQWWTGEELISIGLLGFYQALKNGLYDPSKSRWSTWIINYIWAAIHRAKNHDLDLIHIPAYIKAETHIEIGSFDETLDCVIESNHDEIPMDMGFLERAIDSLEMREAYIIKELFFEGRTLLSIGNDLGLTRERVRQIKESAIFKMRRVNYARVACCTLPFMLLWHNFC